LALFREVGDRWQIALALHRRAAIALHGRHDVAAAAADLLEALDLAESLRSTPDVASMLLTAAEVALTGGQDGAAAELVSAISDRLAVAEEGGWYDWSGGLGALRHLLTDPDLAAEVARGEKHDLRTAASLARKALQDLV
jgi:hypothetical protein